MEGDEQRRRQYEQLNYPRGYATDYGAQGSNVPNLQQLRGPQLDDNPDRFRQGQLSATRTPASTPSLAGAGGPQELGSFAYSQGQQYPTPQMQAQPFHYPPDYLQDSQRQRFSQYPSQMMYNGPQQPPLQSPYNVPQQPHQQSPYDTVGQFQPRQTAAVEVLSNQFGVPPQYYSAGDAPNASVPAAMSQGYQTAPFQQPMQYNAPNTLGRSSLASSYSAIPLDFSQAGSAEEHPENESDVAAENNDRFYRAIRETNHSTSRGMLVQAGDSLMQLSQRLLGNAVRLGFTRDEQAMHAQRLALWDNFNNCWLALLQRQLDETRKKLDTGRSPVPPQSILPAETLEKMGDELVAYCDDLGKFGLVDYQMGVSEEEIIDILNRCLDLLRNDNEEESGPEGGSTAQLPAERRGNR